MEKNMTFGLIDKKIYDELSEQLIDDKLKILFDEESFELTFIIKISLNEIMEMYCMKSIQK